MVFIECTYCKEPTWASKYKLSKSGSMMLRIYKKTCPHCKKEMEFYWHCNEDQIREEEKLEW